MQPCLDYGFSLLNLMILGETFLLENRHGIEHVECRSREFVKKCNRCICRFAYEVFAHDKGQEAIIEKYADVSPVLKTITNGSDIKHQRIFGKRRRLGKRKLKGTLWFAFASRRFAVSGEPMNFL